MRTKSWIALTLVILCSFLVSRSFNLIGIRGEAASLSASTPNSTSSSLAWDAAGKPTPTLAHSGPDTTPPPEEEIADRQQPMNVPLGGLDARALADDNLDFASESEILRVLREAIENERQNRALYISPGVLDAIASGERVRVIFELGIDPTKAAAMPLLAGPHGIAGFDSLRIFPLFDRGAAAVGPQALLQLIESPETTHIELDRIHYASLLETLSIIRADLSHAQGFDGDGYAVAILDTGVDPSHPMFADRLIEEACFSLLGDCPNGESQMLGPGAAIPCATGGCGHGTRVAGIAVGNEIGGSLVGAAPHANLIAIQVFSIIDGAPGAYSSDILAGLQHVLGLAAFHRIATVNLSLGGMPFTSEASCDLAVSSQRNAVALLRAAGILTVAASGNDALTNAMTTPACLSNVIAVGSTSDNDVVSSFSNSASFLRLLAPGESVTTSNTGGGTGVSSGTSMATPHVSGAIATIREAVPSAGADEIDNALGLSGLPVLDTRNGVTTPRLRVQDAIALLASTMPDPEAAEEPPPADGSGASGAAATTSSSGGGGGGCGLVGIEPFMVLGLVRLGRKLSRRKRSSARSANHH